VAGLTKQRVDVHQSAGLALAALLDRMSMPWSSHTISRLWRLVGGIEIVIGLALCFPESDHQAAIAATVVLGIGLGYVTMAWRFAPGLACGCFGMAERITRLTIARSAYVLAWAILLALQDNDLAPYSDQLRVVVVVALSVAIALPVAAASLAPRDLRNHIRQQCSRVLRFAHARLVSAENALTEIRKSDVWREMSEASGADVHELSTVDTWMEGNWRMWELRGSGLGADVHLVAGRYLGTRSGLIRLMLFGSSFEPGEYIGTWDSRMVGSDARDRGRRRASAPLTSSVT